MDTKKLRQKILDLAIHGKLVPQDPTDEPASVLLERIKAEKERLIKEGKIKRSKKSAKTSDTPHYENVPFEIPNNWVWTTLGEISNYGDSNNVSVTDIADDEWILELEDLEKDTASIIQILSKKERSIKGVRHKFKKGDVLYSKLRTYLNKVLVAPQIGYCTTEIIPFNSYCGISTHYLCHVLRSAYFLDYTQQCGYGVKMPRLSTNDACKGMIPLPPLAEQHRIVAEIEKWFSLIDIIENGKSDLQTTIKQTKSKILDLAIHGKLISQDLNDEPAIELLKRINPDYTPCDNGHSEKLPQSWCLSRLKELCSFLSRGKSPKYSDNDKTIPVFAQKCNLKEGGISLEQARFLDPSTICKWSEVYKLQTGDILVNSTGTGTVGRTRLFNESYLGQYPFVLPDSHISVVRAKTGIIPQYLYAYISSNKIQQYIEDNLAGSTNQKELYIGVLEQMEIFVPPLAEQQRIVQKIEELFSALDNIQNALEV
ncbi:restriction endonuclease subunit S [Phocaeicola vulgatus]|jgi:type I restriction enzyme S subunit|uniref:restriction endonuclease subunit S n=1 Tax=Phocaeicola vulgatus TaxID=821 RepID=UPI000E4E12CC|nr:restriction endonuclease subunit S [Phocaeicola vulgatus]MCG0147249.1 restriction endonuclease subunit S [Phocaeicola vulgatus]RGW02692.1 restriction endonuclease subunit S [Phocaeicola vulgatus]